VVVVVVVVVVMAMAELLNVSILSGSSSLIDIDAAFQRNPVQVSVGDTVTWTKDVSQLHTVTSGVNGQPDGRFG
jgi:plastocyanin